MGFYYGSSSPPPDEDDDKIRVRDALALIFAMFRVLAVPLGIMLGGLIVLLVIFWLFSVHLLLGYAVAGAGLTALIARAVWDSRHPKPRPE